MEPIRVSVGLRSAGSPDERAALAVRELERTGAFRSWSFHASLGHHDPAAVAGWACWR
jgi:uncharacterized membrane protein